ncbi:MAG: hypothetical protein JWM16_1667 [Verrucomicrobiales bacterium]|nr:hypothetical protein [Verrucomicrobiales bacterium]
MLEAEQFKPETVISEVAAAKPRIIELPKVASQAPIRPPLRIMWREFRFRILPVLTFILLILGAIVVWRQWITPLDAKPNASVFAGDSKVIPFNPSETVAGK